MPLNRVLMNTKVITAFIMLMIFVSMSLLALGFPAKGRLMPLMIGIPGIILGLVQFFIEIRAVKNTEPKELTAEDLLEKKEERQMFAWTFMFFIGILCFGFIYACPILVFAFMHLGKKESLTAALIGSICTWIMLYGIFVLWFQIPLFDGLIIEHFSN